MFKESATNLLELSKNSVHEWLNTFDAVLTDCDGVLWHNDIAICGSVETITALQACGKHVYFVTNNGTKTRQELWQRAIGMGYNIQEDHIIAPTHSIVEYLQRCQFRQRAYVIGSKAITQELDAANIEHFGNGPDVLTGKLNDYIEREILQQPPGNANVGAVIVGFDEHFTFPKMLKASNYLTCNPNCLFLTTNTDAVHRYPKYHIPGTGAIVKALETCSGRHAVQLGKPNPAICADLIACGTLIPERTLMIGDCCKIDITFGKNCDFQTLLIGRDNGYPLSVIRDMQKDLLTNQQYIPDVYLPNLGDLLQFL